MKLLFNEWVPDRTVLQVFFPNGESALVFRNRQEFTDYAWEAATAAMVDLLPEEVPHEKSDDQARKHPEWRILSIEIPDPFADRLLTGKDVTNFKADVDDDGQ